MLLCTLALLLSVGLRYRSIWFVVWVMLIVSPGWIFFVKVYEERELGLRFGDSYLKYKARTPMLLPRWPRVRDDSAEISSPTVKPSEVSIQKN